jgi:hypothetical protein
MTSTEYNKGESSEEVQFRPPTFVILPLLEWVSEWVGDWVVVNVHECVLKLQAILRVIQQLQSWRVGYSILYDTRLFTVSKWVSEWESAEVVSVKWYQVESGQH